MTEVLTAVIVLGFLSYLSFLAFLSHINSKNLKNDYLLIEKRTTCCNKKCNEPEVMIIKSEEEKPVRKTTNPVRVSGIGGSSRKNEEK